MLAALQHNWIAALYRTADGGATGLRGAQAGIRFGVYRASLVANLTRALAGTYPVIKRLVGTDFFEAMAKHYMQDQPSRHGDIHTYGAHFPVFLETLEPARTLPYLADVARLEWLAHQAFHAADSDPLDLGALAKLSEAQLAVLHVQLHPSLHLMQSIFPVHRIWQINQESTSMTTLDLNEGGARLAVFREGLEIALLPLGAADFDFMAALRQHDLAGACESVLAHHPDFDPGQGLYRVFSQQLVVGLSTAEASCKLQSD